MRGEEKLWWLIWGWVGLWEEYVTSNSRLRNEGRADETVGTTILWYFIAECAMRRKLDQIIKSCNNLHTYVWNRDHHDKVGRMFGCGILLKLAKRANVTLYFFLPFYLFSQFILSVSDTRLTLEPFFPCTTPFTLIYIYLNSILMPASTVGDDYEEEVPPARTGPTIAATYLWQLAGIHCRHRWHSSPWCERLSTHWFL